jgi:hypothetical protein
MPEKMCELNKRGVCTNKASTRSMCLLFSRLRLIIVEIGDSTHVYNHLRKLKVRWIQIRKLRDLSGAQWERLNTSYQGHIMVSTLLHM